MIYTTLLTLRRQNLFCLPYTHKMTKDNKPTGIHWLALALLVVVWGSSFILIKYALVAFNSLQVGGLRIAISFLVLSPWVLQQLKRVPRKKLWYFLASGVIGNGLPPFLFAMAQEVIDSYMAGVLNSLTPLFTLLVGVLFFGIRTRWVNAVGVVLGLGGAIGLLTVAGGGQLHQIWHGLFAVLAALCYATNMNLIKQYLSDFRAITITAVAFFFIGLPSLVYVLFFSGLFQVLATHPSGWTSLSYVAILAVVGTAMAMLVHNWLIRRTSALFASTVTYLMPIVSIGWGMADGEALLPVFALWVGVILLGVYLANLKKKRPVHGSIAT